MRDLLEQLLAKLVKPPNRRIKGSVGPIRSGGKNLEEAHHQYSTKTAGGGRRGRRSRGRNHHRRHMVTPVGADTTGGLHQHLATFQGLFVDNNCPAGDHRAGVDSRSGGGVTQGNQCTTRGRTRWANQHSGALREQPARPSLSIGRHSRTGTGGRTRHRCRIAPRPPVRERQRTANQQGEHSGPARLDLERRRGRDQYSMRMLTDHRRRPPRNCPVIVQTTICCPLHVSRVASCRARPNSDGPPSPTGDPY